MTVQQLDKIYGDMKLHGLLKDGIQSRTQAEHGGTEEIIGL